LLDTETKRRIDTARDILVGKVPDPKSQVEQITIALIYKFMDDMDAESEELGGRRKFFTGSFNRYGWSKLMQAGLGGNEMLGLYAEGIAKMPENPGIPPLFRDIFKNAYLPYRDPETLKAFLKIIDEFTYDHSERLGDAFEYLLAVLGSQGDAGQFRTPRHIIDFIVAIVGPKKGEVVLDPACGTAGFLISAYKHILRANTNAEGQSTLTPDERGRLAENFKGYDISPDMVRLSLVNMYLHGFTGPHIYEYDTLTSEERWNEFADVILANPPFMSPKGGIKPHRRFSIQAKRSEVLFVDYIAEHLTPSGRAGIIVPEGIIFQTQNAYRELRKTLVENSLVAVVSLPAGVFNPYSGVKTSILILDKSLARQNDTIAFFRVENDGFGLGAQRRAIEKNDLPLVQAELAAYLQAPRSCHSVADLQLACGLIVPKAQVAATSDFNLSGERYREGTARNHSFPLVSLGEVGLFRVESGGTPKSDVGKYWNGGIPWATLVDLPAPNFITQITSTKRTISEEGLRASSAKLVPANSVIVSTRATIGRIGINRVPIATNQGFKNITIEDPTRAVPEYVALAITKLVPTMEAWATGGTFPEISKSKFCELHIPLPPLEMQKEIVAEIEGYQNVINGAQAVLDNYRPYIPVHPDWPMEAIGNLCTIERGASPRPIHDFITDAADGVNWIKIGDAEVGGKFVTSTKERVTPAGAAKSRRVKPGDFILSNSMSYGRPYIMATDGCIHDGWLLLRDHSDRLDKDFLYNVLSSRIVVAQFERAATGGVVNNLNSEIVRGVQIPLPPLATQQSIVAEIDAELALVAGNRELVIRFEKKIAATLARVWGEDEASGLGV